MLKMNTLHCFQKYTLKRDPIFRFAEMLIHATLRWPSSTNGLIFWLGRISHHTLTLNGRQKLLCKVPWEITSDHRRELEVLLKPSLLNRALPQMKFQFLPCSSRRTPYARYGCTRNVPHTIICETWKCLDIYLLNPGSHFMIGEKISLVLPYLVIQDSTEIETTLWNELLSLGIAESSCYISFYPEYLYPNHSSIPFIHFITPQLLKL
jgi:hypothetical protein